jgi:hypothetical protein
VAAHECTATPNCSGGMGTDYWQFGRESKLMATLEPRGSLDFGL